MFTVYILLWFLKQSIIYQLDSVSSANPHKLQFPLTFKDYEGYLGGQATLLGTFLVRVESHDVSWLSRVPVHLALPNLNISVNGKG